MCGTRGRWKMSRHFHRRPQAKEKERHKKTSAFFLLFHPPSRGWQEVHARHAQMPCIARVWINAPTIKSLTDVDFSAAMQPADPVDLSPSSWMTERWSSSVRSPHCTNGPPDDARRCHSHHAHLSRLISLGRRRLGPRRRRRLLLLLKLRALVWKTSFLASQSFKVKYALEAYVAV